jgi:hypothetical protein
VLELDPDGNLSGAETLSEEERSSVRQAFAAAVSALNGHRPM